jgi:hypothetical protein
MKAGPFEIAESEPTVIHGSELKPAEKKEEGKTEEKEE